MHPTTSRYSVPLHQHLSYHPKIPPRNHVNRNSRAPCLRRITRCSLWPENHATMPFQIPWNVKKSEIWRKGKIHIQIDDIQMIGIMDANGDYPVLHQGRRPISRLLPLRTILSYDVPSHVLNPNRNHKHKFSNLSLVSFIDRARIQQTRLGVVLRLGWQEKWRIIPCLRLY